MGRAAAPLTRGLGAILMFHHVRPWVDRDFAPNRGLEITPAFLDVTIRAVKAAGYEIVTLDDAVARMQTGEAKRPFAVLTFDDGYRDTLAHALPVLRRHGAPFTLYVTPGFAGRTARLWWIELEEAFRRLAHVEVEAGGRMLRLSASTDSEKSDSFRRLYWLLRSVSEEELLAVVAGLAEQAGVVAADVVASLCMNWEALAEIANDPLCTVGAHTLTHPMLAKHPVEAARREMAESRRMIEVRLGRPVRHLAYPVGDPTSAGPREFALAAELGFMSAVTTRKGMIYPEHASHLLALPRLSINGDFQTPAALDALLSGAPFFLMNFGRRLDVG
jgi:peptidoglycan/xylan/chitin deacetylase (PgdA/CDA1 family)